MKKTMITVQNAENALKSIYLGAITELLNTKANPLLAKIENTSADVWGKEVRKVVALGINGGIGAGSETGDLPTSNGREYIQFVQPLKNLYGQIEISDKAIRASADGKGAFTDILDAELQSLLEASKFNLGRMLYGNGTGLLCTVSAKSGNDYPVSKVNNLIEGLLVDLYDVNFEKISTGPFRIKGINRGAKKVVLEGANQPALAGGGYMYVQGSRDSEITGINSLFSGNTIYGVNRAELEFLKGKKISVNGPIDDIVIQGAVDKLEYEANSTVDFLACAADVKYAYQEYLGNFKRNIDVMELEGGYKSISFNGIPLVYDRFVDDGKMYLINTKILKMHQLCDWRFLENENGKILRQTQGKPTYSATLVKYCELMCDKPGGIGLLEGITR